jgi:hypothetical protein
VRVDEVGDPVPSDTHPSLLGTAIVFLVGCTFHQERATHDFETTAMSDYLASPVSGVWEIELALGMILVEGKEQAVDLNNLKLPISVRITAW